jgi:long-chain acyl-CoA synthetase
LLTGYGLTEATALVTLTSVRLDEHGGMERDRTIGRVLPGMELSIIDDEGRASHRHLVRSRCVVPI